MKHPAITQEAVRDVGTAVKEAAKDNNIDTDKVLFIEDAVLLTYRVWEAAKGLFYGY